MKIQILKNKLIGLIIPVVLFVVWDLLTRFEIVPNTLMPAPKVLFETWWDMQNSGELLLNMKMSLLRVGAGFLIGASSGFLLGTAMGLWKPVEQYLNPVFNFFRQVPIVAWIPFLLIWLGIDEWFKIIFISCGALIPMALKTYDGIKGVPASYLEVVRVFEYGWFRLLRAVVLPSALPSIITGLRLSLSEAWMLVIGAELVAAGEGIGNVMVIARRLFQTDVVIVGVIVIAITGFIMDKVIGLLEIRFLGWQQQTKSAK
jgi:sulfonate transport system permease protein